MKAGPSQRLQGLLKLPVESPLLSLQGLQQLRFALDFLLLGNLLTKHSHLVVLCSYQMIRALASVALGDWHRTLENG